MPHSIRTERLLLRPVIRRDAIPFWRALNDPDYTRMTGTWSYPFTPETVLRRIGERERDGTSKFEWFTILHRGELAGSGLLFGSSERVMEIGYSITRSLAGQGLATEAARALCAFGFGTLRLTAIKARVSTGNPASSRILTRLGFEQLPEIDMGWSEHYGRNTPLYHYRLIRERFRP